MAVVSFHASKMFTLAFFRDSLAVAQLACSLINVCVPAASAIEIAII